MANHNRRAASGRANNLINDYKNLRTIPAVLGMVFFASTLYQFGAVTEVQFEWFEYTLTTMHAVAVSLIVYLVAFASSETRNFDAYDGWEKALIAAGPLLIALHQWYDPVNEWIMTTSEPWMQIAAAAVVLIGYGVAVQ